MNSESRAIFWGIWSLLGLVVFSVAGVFVSTLLRARSAPLPVLATVSDFKLTNQLAKAVSLADLQGHVWVADVIFTRCPGPCLQMTKEMRKLQAALPADGSVKFVSLTADPTYDSPSVLKQYATRLQADQRNWDFLTGPKADVYRVAMKGLKLAVQDTPSTNIDDEFIHSTRFVVIDRQGQLRSASFEGTEPDVVPGLARTVKRLLAEK